MKTLTTELVAREDGIMVDPTTGLMWMLPVLGQRWHNGAVVGNGMMLSWEEATVRFGKGRRIDMPAGNWNAVDEGRSHLIRRTYEGYRFGTKAYEFGGFSDWRLPTVEEFFSLAETRNHNVITEDYRFWLANPSNYECGGGRRGRLGGV